MTLRRLIPFSPALAVLAIGCNDSRADVAAATGMAADGAAADAQGDTTSLDDVALADVLLTDVPGTDTTPSDVITRPDTTMDSGPDVSVDVGVDATPADVSVDSGMRTISDETREAQQQFCNAFVECGFGRERECLGQISEQLINYAYSYAEDFAACDTALGKVFTCFSEAFSEQCSEEAQYNCELELRDMAYDCDLDYRYG